MYMHRRAGSMLALIALAALILVGCGRGGGAGGSQGGSSDQEKTYKIQLSHVVTEQTPKGLAAKKFAELLEKKSDGRIKVEVFPNSQLYGDAEEMQAIQKGSVQMLAPTTSKFTTISKNMQVLDLPFIFDNYDDFKKITGRDTPVGKILYQNKQLTSKNIKVLALWPDGFKQLASNKPIRAPEDLKGLKIRVQPADVLRTMFKTWGAQPTPIDFAELYTALEQGVVSGHENPYSVIYGSKANQVQKYITESSHGMNVSVAAINADFFNGLPKDLQEDVVSAAEEASVYGSKIALEQNGKGKQQILDAGTTKIIELTPEQRQAFKDEVVPEVWDEYSDVIGKDVIDYLKEQQGSGGKVVKY